LIASLTKRLRHEYPAQPPHDEIFSAPFRFSIAAAIATVPKEAETARKIIAAFDLPENGNTGVLGVDGALAKTF
jgi:hypothetical protein